MRPRSRQLAPRGRNRQAASPRPSGGGVRGPECSPPSPPPPAQEQTEADRRDSGPALPRGGRCTQKGGQSGRGKRGRAPSAPGEPPARSRITRYRPTTERRRPGRRKQSCPLRGRPGEGGGANHGEEITPPLPTPPRRTDPLAAHRAAPDAHGCPATPTAQVYSRGARQIQRMAGRHPTWQGGGEQQSAPPSPPPPPPLPPWPAGHRSANPLPPRSRVRPAAAATRPGRPLGSEVQPVRGRRTTATPSVPPPPASPMLAQQVMEDDVKGERMPRRCPAQVTSPSPRPATPEWP